MQYEPGFYVVVRKDDNAVFPAQRRKDEWWVWDHGHYSDAYFLKSFTVLGGPLSKDSLVLTALKGNWVCQQENLQDQTFNQLYQLPDDNFLVHWTTNAKSWYQSLSRWMFDCWFKKESGLPAFTPGMRVMLGRSNDLGPDYKVILISKDDTGWIICDETLRPYHITNEKLAKKFVKQVDEEKKKK